MRKVVFFYFKNHLLLLRISSFTSFGKLKKMYLFSEHLKYLN